MDKNKAREKSDKLLESIGTEYPVNEFSEKYFPIGKTDAVLRDLKGKCDFVNRKGGFVDEEYLKTPGKEDEVSFIYEYKLKCGAVKIILTYKLNKTLDLYKFSIKPSEVQN